ncbi:MAG: replication-associated recombination protein A [Thermomicrobiales bacterium]
MTLDLFAANRDQQRDARAPLAAKMRPRTLDELVGQESIVGPGTLLRRAIETDRLSSIILWGPPGAGKTTIARVIAGTTRAHFISLSAVTSGVQDLRNAIKEANEHLGMHGQRTVLFIDEIHRFNKAQQDAILPHVEDGTVILIGATTENPSFEVNSPLLSRSRVVRLQALSDNDIRRILVRALNDQERGLGKLGAKLDDDALDLLVNLANGDARFALNTLEYASAGVGYGEQPVITSALVTEAAQRRAATYDKSGDDHFDAISALQTIRGSDADAALYWLARMLERRRSALRRPPARAIRIRRCRACRSAGCSWRWPLSRRSISSACRKARSHSPNWSSTWRSLRKAMRSTGRGAAHERCRGKPQRSGSAPLAQRPGLVDEKQGYGHGYKYAHDFEEGIVGQVNRPANVSSNTYYTPTDRGFESELSRRLARVREIYARTEGTEEES